MIEDEDTQGENISEIEENYDSSDKVAVNKVRKKFARQKIIRDEAIRKIMSDPDCRSWIAYVLAQADIDGNPHVPGVPDATSFNCGMANLGRLIWKEVRDAAPESAILMLKEAEQNAKGK